MDDCEMKDENVVEKAVLAAARRLYQKDQRGKPCKDRAETVTCVALLQGTLRSQVEGEDDDDKFQRPPLTNVYGQGPLLLSDIPETAKKGGLMVGIDEAGRGSLLGPMTYGVAFWSAAAESRVPRGLGDSKQLKEEKRARLFEEILRHGDVGFGVRVLHASEISRNMLRPEPYNLNQMSHDAAAGLIRSLLDANLTIDTCYVDTVGPPSSYQKRLEREFSGCAVGRFVVESKADDKYAPCSAASIGKKAREQ
jgi:ribonuclease H2 subunit A